MKIRNRLSGNLLLAALSLACLSGGLNGCLDDGGDQTLETPALTGSVRNTCGPADGPAVGVRVDRKQPKGCINNLDLQDSTNNKYVLFFPDIRVDSLEVGKTYSDTLKNCEPFICVDRQIYDLKVEKIQGNEVHGSLQVKTSQDGLPGITTKTPIILSICPQFQTCG